MQAHTTAPFVDTNIVPDRNAGIGSLLWDLQHPQEQAHDEPPLLHPAFAFLDVGVSRARVAVALKTLLVDDLGMDVEYVATERPEAVPYASISLVGHRGEAVRRCLSRMISSTQAVREVSDWHYVVNRQGTVSSVAYSYPLYGNEVWEAYFMGRAFIHGGARVEFSDPELDAVLAVDVPTIEARVAAERQRSGDPRLPAPSWDGYVVRWNPLEADLAACGIPLQATDVPSRVDGLQNVLFLGNVLNHHPPDAQAREFDRIAARMDAGDLIVVQSDGIEAPSIEVFHVARHGRRTVRECVRWIDTRTLDVRMRARGCGEWRQLHLQPEVTRMARSLVEGLGRGQADQQADVLGPVSHLLLTFFRAVPVDATRRVALRAVAQRVAGACGVTVEADPSPVAASSLHDPGLTSSETEAPPHGDAHS